MNKNLVIAVLTAAVLSVSCGNNSNDLSGNWVVTEISGVIININETMPYISIDASNNEYHGATGVNTLNGCVKISKGKINFSDGAMTRMVGSPEAMAVEDQYINVLNAVETYDILSDGSVVLKTAEGLTMKLTRQ